MSQRYENIKEQHRAFFNQANENIRKFYTESGLDYVPTAEHRTHAEFAAKAQTRPVKRHIDQIHRIKVGGIRGKESMFFSETHIGTDHRGNRIKKFLINGKYEMPIGQYQYDEKTGTNVCTGIADFETVYQIPFDAKVIEQLVDEGEIDDSTQFYLHSGGRVYGGIGFEDFKTMQYDDLNSFCRTGTKPEEPKSKDKKQ